MTALFLPFFAYAALVLFVLYLAAKVCDWLDDAAPEHDPHAELHCLDDPEPWALVDRTTCGHVHGSLTCDRYPGHPLPHADSRSGRGDRPVMWVSGEEIPGGAA